MIYLIVGIFVLSFIGGIISRWHGGGFIGGSPKVLKNITWALPFSVFAFMAYTHPFSWVWAAAALTLCLFGKATGHGRGLSLLDPVTGKPERLEFMISWLYGRVSDYWYQVAILSVTGAAAVFGCAIAVFWQSPISALCLLVGGALKGLAYMIGWGIYPNGTGGGIKHLNEATQIGEFLTGVLAYLALGVAIFLFFNY